MGIGLLLLRLALASWAMDPEPPYGVLLLAPGGEKMRKESAAAAQALGPGVPAATVHGTADTAELQAAVDKLAAGRARKVVVVPLMLSSSFEPLEWAKASLGLKGARSAGDCKGASCGAAAVRTGVPLSVVPALDDHPFAVQILLERLKAVSRDSSRESVVLVGFAPAQDRGRKAVERSVKAAAHAIRKNTAFKAVRSAVLRERGAPAEKARAAGALREAVGRATSDGKVLVVAYVLAWEGEEDAVARALKGLSYVWDPRPFLPHPLVDSWVKESAGMGARMEDMRRFAAADPRRLDGLKSLLRRDAGAAAPPPQTTGGGPACGAAEACAPR